MKIELYLSKHGNTYDLEDENDFYILSNLDETDLIGLLDKIGIKREDIDNAIEWANNKNNMILKADMNKWEKEAKKRYGNIINKIAKECL